ncbi:EcsC family protein [Nocardioides marinquilinus]|uniref:EcsC family protein n=1 Tax=Nocardioides marinquilinus TaxID=1210400 RepID=UPI0031EC5570
MREALKRALHGVGPLAGAEEVARKQLESHDGDVEKAVGSVVDAHVRLAGATGLVTNVGGLVTMTVTVPANLTGLAVLQCRMVAAVAHLRGYDLADPRVHNAVLITTLGSDAVDDLVKRRTLPAPPMALATAPAHDPALDATVSTAVARHLITRITGRRLATTVGRRVPGLGGVVGMGADGFATWKVGKYAERELRPRKSD